MPRTAKPADIAKLAKAMQAVGKAWADANYYAFAYQCRGKRGNKVVETVLSCQFGITMLEERLGRLSHSIHALDAASARLPAGHPMGTAGWSLSKSAWAGYKLLIEVQGNHSKRLQKMAKQLGNIKHK